MWSNLINKGSETKKQSGMRDKWPGWRNMEENKMEHKKLEVGEEYYSVVIEFGGVKHQFSAFKNESYGVKAGSPLARGTNVVIFVNKKKAETTEEVMM